jgi:translocation and assembly module TamA
MTWLNATVQFHTSRCFLLLVLIFSISLGWGDTAFGQLSVPYEVRVEGVEDDDLNNTLRAVSNIVSLQETPPATVSLLRRRAENDIPRLTQALASQGYYASEVSAEMDEEREPVLVTFRIVPGPLYPLESVTIETVDQKPVPMKEVPSPEDMGLTSGEPARARQIINAQDAIIRAVRNEGFPFAEVADRRVVVDHSVRRVRVTYIVNPGPRARFGPVSIAGMETVEEDFIRSQLQWEQGGWFDASLLEKTRNRLVETRLFSLAQVSHAEQLDESGQIPIIVEVRERLHRSVTAGVNYYTDQGPGVRVSWEHRNFFNQGERLRLEAAASGIGYSGSASFRKPAFLRDDQWLLLNFKLGQDDTDAFTSRNTEISAVVEREIRKGMRLGGGPGFRFSRVDSVEDADDENFALLFLQSYFNWDRSDHQLDPTRGGRWNVQLTPFWDTLNTGVSFLKGYTSYSHYFQLSEQPSIIFAGRAAVGSMIGVDRDSIPADVRLYAGGGGSIRGYSFQSAGPLIGNEPVGGRSVLELSAEFRFRITQSIGLATFLDGGRAFDAVYPDFSDPIQWGAGVGIRYHTPIGPLRLDVATPLNPRKGVDDPFQIYVSIGQAF